jgi:CheY-like chemotaxis protein
MVDDAPRPNSTESLSALGQVAGELVHDLANEVQVLQGWAMLARGEAVGGNPPVNELQRVVEISSRLGRMLRDMLETVSGQTVSPELVFDPHSLTEATVNERVREMSSLDVHFRSTLPEGTRVAGRASFWSRVVSNLLINASRYAYQAVAVTLATRIDPEGRRSVVLRVEDDGPGVSVTEQEEIFLPFWRGNKGGAGLGLSSVAWSITELRGSVRYATDSVLGGAAFEVSVPAATAPAMELVQASPAQVSPETCGQLQGLRLLLVDDDRSVSTALGRLMQREGAKVKQLDPGKVPDERLVKTIEKSRADVILLDVHLGDRGGVSLWRTLAATAAEIASRVVFVTGLVAGDPAWEEADATGQPVLGKPFDLPDLVRILSRLRTGG